jgi:hypothetical protein
VYWRGIIAQLLHKVTSVEIVERVGLRRQLYTTSIRILKINHYIARALKQLDMATRNYYDIERGDVYVEATIVFKGVIRGATLHDMTEAEWIADIIDSGDYEYEVLQGNTTIENVEKDYEELD